MDNDGSQIVITKSVECNDSKKRESPEVSLHEHQVVAAPTEIFNLTHAWAMCSTYETAKTMSPLLGSAARLSHVCFEIAKPMELLNNAALENLQNILKPLQDAMQKYQSYSSRLSESLLYFASAVDSMKSLTEQLVKVNLAPFLEALKQARFAFDFDLYEKQHYSLMLEARWFPFSIHHRGISIIIDLSDIVSHSRQSNVRIKKIDKCIFAYFSNTEIEQMRKSWRQYQLPHFILRMLNETVRAYNRKEYATTIAVLSSLWEWIIADKVADYKYRTSNGSKKSFRSLVDANAFPSILADFYDTYIMYNCKSPADTKKDVPGRHAAAHGLYMCYPSKKAALNAIIFTDFLLSLQPVMTEEQ